LAQQQHAAVRGQPPAIEGEAQLLAPNGWQFEGQKAIVLHGGCGAPVIRERLCLDNKILHEINGLRYIRQPKISAAMNNPG
ncbi:MAG: hypothetical protein WD673_04510, partial [Alphaproteobacteria bacterium]